MKKAIVLCSKLVYVLLMFFLGNLLAQPEMIYKVYVDLIVFCENICCIFKNHIICANNLINVL